MTKKDTNDLESSLLVIKLDDTPWRTMRAPLQKRRIPSSAASGTSSKQRRIYDQESYQSPLLHLGPTSHRRTRFTSVDDGVIVLEKLTNSPALDRTALSISEKKLPICADDSIIILSDNEGESKAEKNLGVILEDDSEFMEITPTRKVTKKKPVRHRFPFPPCCKADVETRATADRGQLPKKKRSKPTRWSEANVVQSQSILIDSEDENTIPNDVSSRPNPQVKIITVDDSPDVVTNKDIHHPATTESVVDVNKKNDQISASSAEPSSSWPAATSGDVSDNEQPMIAKSISKACSRKKKARKKKLSVFCIDTKGTCSSGGLNCRVTQCIKKRDAMHLAVEELQNPNFAEATKNVSTRDSPLKKPSEPINRPELNGIRNYYTEEIIAKAPGSLREIVIDGCNIAKAYTNGKSFSETGLKMVIDYFVLRGHTVKAFVPHHVRSWQYKLLERLHIEGIVVFTPSRRVGSKTIASYDDRYILDYATLCDGIVVSQDQYRDLYKEKRDWREVIEKRLLVPTFAGKCLMFPEDPLGRAGPCLEAFLRH